MAIEILDSWKAFDTNLATIKTSKGTFVISRGKISYTVEGTVEHFDVKPYLSYQKYIRIFWYAGENPRDLSKTSKEFRDDLSRIKDLTGVDPFELMEIVKDKER